MPVADNGNLHGFVAYSLPRLTDVQSNQREVANIFQTLIQSHDADPREVIDLLRRYDQYGMTPLHWAGHHNNFDLMVVLVTPVLNDEQYRTGLYDILCMGVIQAPENLESCPVGSNLFQLNLRGGNSSLISMGHTLEIPDLEDVLLSSGDDDPAICIAAAHNLDLLKTVADAGSYILLRDSRTREGGWSAMHIAAMNCKTTEGKEMLAYLLDKCQTREERLHLLSLRDRDRLSVLDHLALNSNAQAIDAILQRISLGDAATVLNESGSIQEFTFLHVSAMFGSTDIVSSLVKRLPKGEWQKMLLQPDSGGETALTIALNENYPGIILLMSEFCGNVEVRQKLLSSGNIEERFYGLLSKIIDPTHPYLNALHYAAALGDSELAKFIIEKLPSNHLKEYLKQANSYGENFLHIAADHNRYNFLQELLNINPGEAWEELMIKLLNSHSLEGLSPLHVAAQEKKHEFLIAALRSQNSETALNALLNQTTSQGKSLSECATGMTRSVIIDLMEILTQSAKQIFDNYQYNLYKVLERLTVNQISEKIDTFCQRFTEDNMENSLYSYILPQRSNWVTSMLIHMKRYDQAERLLCFSELYIGRLQHLINKSILRYHQGRFGESLFLAYEFNLLKEQPQQSMHAQSCYAELLMCIGDNADPLDALRIIESILNNPSINDLSLEEQWELNFKKLKLLPRINKCVPKLDRQQKMKYTKQASEFLVRISDINQEIKRREDESSLTTFFDLMFDVWLAELMITAKMHKDINFPAASLKQRLGCDDFSLVVNSCLQEAAALHVRFSVCDAGLWARIAKSYKDLYLIEEDAMDRSYSYYESAMEYCDKALDINFNVVAAYTKILVILEKRNRTSPQRLDKRRCLYGTECPGGRRHIRYHMNVVEKEHFLRLEEAFKISDEIFQRSRFTIHLPNNETRLKIMYALGRPMDEIVAEGHRDISKMKDWQKSKIHQLLGCLYDEKNFSRNFHCDEYSKSVENFQLAVKFDPRNKQAAMCLKNLTYSQ